MSATSKSLRGRVAIVTGAAAGIGAATATLLHRAGAAVLLVDIEQVAVECLASELGAGRAAAYSVDLADDGAAAAIVGATVERFGRIDTVVNNAAVQTPSGTVVSTSTHDWERHLAVNLLAPAELAAAAMRWLQVSEGGSIVNIGSLSSFLVFPHQAAYAASKGAILQLTRSIALDYGPQGVRCNCVCPGPVYSGPVVAGAHGSTPSMTLR